MFQGADDSEEPIYSGGTHENHSWLRSKGLVQCIVKFGDLV